MMLKVIKQGGYESLAQYISQFTQETQQVEKIQLLLRKLYYSLAKKDLVH